MGRAYNRGHEIYFNYVKEEWRYSDDDSSADNDRACKRCKHYPTDEGHDHCLGNLGDNVKAACCGHGVERGYIMLKDGRMFYLEGDYFTGFQMDSKKDDENHIITIDQFHNGHIISSVRFAGDNDYYDENTENMGKVCALLNDLQREPDGNHDP